MAIEDPSTRREKRGPDRRVEEVAIKGHTADAHALGEGAHLGRLHVLANDRLAEHVAVNHDGTAGELRLMTDGRTETVVAG